jgi:type IV secretory pathway VirB9-like protein
MIKANNIKKNLMVNIEYCIKKTLFFLMLVLALGTTNVLAYEDDLPITSDHRIKTYIYNPNEVYLIVVHSGFQSHIEFAKGEGNKYHFYG